MYIEMIREPGDEHTRLVVSLICYTKLNMSNVKFFLQHDHPYISSMVNDGSMHYDHDRDGTHGQMDGCTVSG